MDESKTGVYAIKCIANNRVYVGSAARNFRHRWTRHRNDLNARRHYNKSLQNAWNKYGPDQFEFSILLICEPSECVAHEQRFIDELNATSKKTGFNSCPQAGSSRGFRHTEESRRKMSEGRKGLKMSEESRAKSAATQRGRKRPEFSAEWRDKLGAVNRGRKKSDETRARMSAGMTGREKSPEHCAAISRAKAGKKTKPLSEASRAKIAESKIGKKRPLHVIEAMQRGRREAKAKRLAEQVKQ